MTETHGFSKKQVGAIGEALAVAWLLMHGFEVYTQFGEGVFDLVAYDPVESRLIRVEVKTGKIRHSKRNGTEKIYWTVREGQEAHVDMLLVTVPDGRVWDATGLENPIVGDPERDVRVVSTATSDGKARRTSMLDENGNRRVT